MSDIKRAVLFIRVRHIGPDEAAATEAQIAAQRAAGQQAARQLNAEIVHEYIEHGGTDRLERRPVVRQMLAELAPVHGADYVITASGDRLARGMREFAAIETDILAAGAVLVIASMVPEMRLSPVAHMAMTRLHFTMGELDSKARKEARYGTPRQANIAG